MRSEPLVSVIIPTYNYARFICEAIDSVLSSDFPQNQIEIIVIDDGSTDDTLKVIQLYKDRVIYIAQENGGKAWATKTGISHAKGKYLFNLDADDLFLPNKIRDVVNVFETDKDVVHVGHPAIYWDFKNNIKTSELIPNLIKGNKIAGKELLSYFYKQRLLFGGGSTFAGRSEILKGLDITKEIDMFIDEYLVLFTAIHGYSFFTEQPLSIWRIHGKNFSDLKSDQSMIKAKAARSLASMETVLDKLLLSNFQQDVKRLYLLKTKVARLATKEEIGKRSFLDVLDIWLYTLKNLSYFKYDTLSLIRNYTILNRSMPIFMLKLLKQVKRLIRASVMPALNKK